MDFDITAPALNATYWHLRTATDTDPFWSPRLGVCAPGTPQGLRVRMGSKWCFFLGGGTVNVCVLVCRPMRLPCPCACLARYKSLHLFGDIGLCRRRLEAIRQAGTNPRPEGTPVRKTGYHCSPQWREEAYRWHHPLTLLPCRACALCRGTKFYSKGADLNSQDMLRFACWIFYLSKSEDGTSTLQATP